MVTLNESYRPLLLYALCLKTRSWFPAREVTNLAIILVLSSSSVLQAHPNSGFEENELLRAILAWETGIYFIPLAVSHSCIKLLTKPSQLVQSCHAAMLLVKFRDVIWQLQLFIPKAGMIITLIAHTEPTAQISRMGALNLSDSTPCYSRLQFIQCVTLFSLITSVYIWILRPHLI